MLAELAMLMRAEFAELFEIWFEKMSKQCKTFSNKHQKTIHISTDILQYPSKILHGVLEVLLAVAPRRRAADGTQRPRRNV